MGLQSFHQLEVLDKNKNLILKRDPEKSKSFVKAFLQMLYVDMDSSSLASTTDLDGTLQTMSDSSNQFERQPLYVAHPGGDGLRGVNNWHPADEIGILVGTSSTPILITDFDLIARINHGTEIGQLEYLSCSVENLQKTSGTDVGSFDIVRLFRNFTGSGITINEIGLSQHYTTDGAPGTNRFLTIRDIISPGQAVADEEYLKVTYTLKITT